MFETVKFGFRAGMLVSHLTKAARAKEVGNDRVALVLLKKAMQAGRNALSIKSSKITDEQRAEVQSLISSAQNFYRQEVLAQMSEEDRELLASVLKTWFDIGTVTIGAPALDQVSNMFEIAKNRLDSGKEVLGIIYKDDHVPEPLQNIMRAFLAGDATREETEERLDKCAAKLMKWMPELFPGEPLPVR